MFKVYRAVFQYMYILRNDYYNKINYPSPPIVTIVRVCTRVCGQNTGDLPSWQISTV